MCGRYTLIHDVALFANAFDAQVGVTDVDWSSLIPRYNVAPTTTVPVIVARDNDRVLLPMRWGLIPFWAEQRQKSGVIDKKGKYVNTPFNARGETVDTTRSFSGGFKSRRVIIPASGFYEWKKAGKEKTPLYITLKDDEPMGFAGICGTWKSSDGEVVESCTIVTTVPNEFMEPIHDRMPVILPPDAQNGWLDNNTTVPTALKEFLVPYDPTEMQAREVVPKVNSVANDGPDLIVQALT
jgi:putative SOS response-associated peptidase YedK